MQKKKSIPPSPNAEILHVGPGAGLIFTVSRLRDVHFTQSNMYVSTVHYIAAKVYIFY